MKYIFRQNSGGTSTICVIEYPRIKNGALYTTRIGVLKGWDDEGKELFKACPRQHFIAGGNWTLEEFIDKLE